MSIVDESSVKIDVLESSSDFNCVKGFLGETGLAFDSVVLSGSDSFCLGRGFACSISEPRREVSCSGALCKRLFSHRDLIC